MFSKKVINSLKTRSKQKYNSIEKFLFKTNRILFSSEIETKKNKEESVKKEKIKFFFKNTKENTIVEVEGEVGQSVLDVAHKFKQDLEGACDQSLACSTCHVILDQDTYNKLNEACEEEEDLLDNAFGLTLTSRLGCQIKVTELLKGKIITIPAATRNLYVDGHKPEPH